MHIIFFRVNAPSLFVNTPLHSPVPTAYFTLICTLHTPLFFPNIVWFIFDHLFFRLRLTHFRHLKHANMSQQIPLVGQIHQLVLLSGAFVQSKFLSVYPSEILLGKLSGVRAHRSSDPKELSGDNSPGDRGVGPFSPSPGFPPLPRPSRPSPDWWEHTVITVKGWRGDRKGSEGFPTKSLNTRFEFLRTVKGEGGGVCAPAYQAPAPSNNSHLNIKGGWPPHPEEEDSPPQEDPMIFWRYHR